MDPFTLAIGANVLGSVAGGIFGNQAAKKQQKAVLEQQRRAMAFIQQGLERAESAQLKGISSIQSGYADAIKSVGGMGQTAQARLLQRERAMMGASDAAMMSRGLYSSTQALGQRRRLPTRPTWAWRKLTRPRLACIPTCLPRAGRLSGVRTAT